jgi:3-methylcrotonyl-CoA carboxylase alpha subunit
MCGHAIEARLYAEDPERDFLPQTGTLHRLHLPPADMARVDTGVREGDAVTPFYDPLIAKIIAWGDDRPAAVNRLRRALAETAVVGLRTNLGFLARIAGHPAFADGIIDTGFIERHRAALLPGARAIPDEALAAAGLHRLLARKAAAATSGSGSADPFSPWATSDGWRLGKRAGQTLRFRCGAEDRDINARVRDSGWLLRFGDRQLASSVETRPDGICEVTLDGVKRRVRVLDHDVATAVFIDGESWLFEEIDPLAPAVGEAPGAGKLTAPMPGKVSRLWVEPGAKVRRGDPLMVVEAMKMEHTISAPADGVVAAVRFSVGELVEEGTELIALASPAADGT